MKIAFGEYRERNGKPVFQPARSGRLLAVADADPMQSSTIQSWSEMRWDKENRMFVGIAGPALLDRLSGMVRLPPNAERRRSELLQAAREAVDRERVNPEPEPFYPYPVKTPLYAHQVRGANMCLLVFGWVELEGGQEHG